MLDVVQEEVLIGFSVNLNKVDFAVALSHVQAVVEKRNVLPILSNVLIETFDNKVKITATDMDIVVSEVVNASINKSGAITVDARMLYDIVRKLDDSSDVRIDFDQTKSRIAIISKNCSFSLSVLSASEFPKLDDEKYDHHFSIQAHELQRIIDECKFAISSEETRYNLNGIYMHVLNGRLRMVATDGHRLCCSDSVGGFDLPDFEGVIIPRKSIIEVGKIIDSLGGNIEVALSQNKVKFGNDSFVFVSKLISARFPDYLNLMPDDNQITIQISTKDFAKAVDRISVVTNEKFRGIKFELEDSRFVVSSRNDDGSFAKETLLIDCDKNLKFEIGFNARYIADVMSVIRGDKICLKFKDNFSPAVIVDMSNGNFQYIIMPMRV